MTFKPLYCVLFAFILHQIGGRGAILTSETILIKCTTFTCNENAQTLVLLIKNTNVLLPQRLHNCINIQSHLKEWQPRLIYIVANVLLLSKFQILQRDNKANTVSKWEICNKTQLYSSKSLQTKCLHSCKKLSKVFGWQT